MSRATSHRLRDSPCRAQRPRSIPPNGAVHIYPVRFIMKLDNNQINGTDGHDWNKTGKLFIWLVNAGPALRQNPRGSLTSKTLFRSHCYLFFFSKNIFLLLSPHPPKSDSHEGSRGRVLGFSRKRRFLNLFFWSKRRVSLPRCTKELVSNNWRV